MCYEKTRLLYQYTWCDSEGDYGRVTIEEDDCIYFQVVDVKEG